MADRYEGKPLLRLIELYVMWAIDALPAEEEAKADAMTPKLQQVYKTKGEWHEILEKALKFPPDMPAQIRKLWEHNKELSRLSNQRIHPEDFAVLYVDRNILKKI